MSGFMRGEILNFKRGGFIASVLGWLIKKLDPEWDGWGWHLAIRYDDKYMLEATGKGVKLSPIKGEYRTYKVLSYEPDNKQILEFLDKTYGAKYDTIVYVWTILWYIGQRFNINVPRIINNRYTCWELVYYFCREMGEPICEQWEYPMINDFVMYTRLTEYYKWRKDKPF